MATVNTVYSYLSILTKYYRESLAERARMTEIMEVLAQDGYIAGAVI